MNNKLKRNFLRLIKSFIIIKLYEKFRYQKNI